MDKGDEQKLYNKSRCDPARDLLSPWWGEIALILLGACRGRVAGSMKAYDLLACGASRPCLNGG